MNNRPKLVSVLLVSMAVVSITSMPACAPSNVPRSIEEEIETPIYDMAFESYWDSIEKSLDAYGTDIHTLISDDMICVVASAGNTSGGVSINCFER